MLVEVVVAALRIENKSFLAFPILSVSGSYAGDKPVEVVVADEFDFYTRVVWSCCFMFFSPARALVARFRWSVIFEWMCCRPFASRPSRWLRALREDGGWVDLEFPSTALFVDGE
ncbi:hypothetical protein PR202_ga26091 [Eleusine coracana subsp. coracana]|uniref:Secreted protein n=1 Tax=Eleusine coracana subsp. coracana TaxID=191504 RepID=A0AAV5DD46_ELECO|nr:hypothetical protein PR202_ga26091 [Eleusine coracana subsp. coracana]